MDEHPVEQGGAAAGKPGLLRRMLGWYWGQRDSADRGEPVKRTLVALALLAVGVAGSEAYGYVRDKFRDPDAYLVKMKQDQDAAFERLQDRLGELSRSVEGGGREALAAVKDAVGEMRSANAGLIAQLDLAKQENARLSQVAGRQAGVTGGYDFILSDNTGLALDASTVIGVHRIASNGAWVTVSSAGAPDQSEFLKSGESIAFRGAGGRQCKASVLSVASGSSVSFKKSCS